MNVRTPDNILFRAFQVQQFSVGDIVKVTDVVALVKDLQKGHGEWADNMRTVSDLLGSKPSFISYQVLSFH